MRLLTFVVLVLWSLACIGIAEAGPIPLPLGVNGPPVFIWDPSESFPGGQLTDTRLDQSVHFWRTAIPISEVFTKVKEQTNVEVLCWPAGDQNERIRVNLYLNEKQPPILRELLAQLSWVLDCVFACTDGESRKYYLLSTSIGQDLEKKLKDAQEAYRSEQAEWLKQGLEKVRSKLEEYRGLLGLSREEAISRYKESDPMMLLNLLEPSRRALIQFLQILSPERLDVFNEKEYVSIKIGELSREEQELLVTVFHSNIDEIKQYNLWINFFSRPTYTGLSFNALVLSQDLTNKRIRGPSLPVNEHQPLSSRDEVALRKELGEDINEEQAQKLEDELRAKRDREYFTRQGQEQSRKLQEAPPALSEATKEILTKLQTPAPFNFYIRYSLWQVQEMIAKKTGMHIISDCFFDHPSNPAHWLSLLDKEFAEKYKALNEQIRTFGQEHPEEMQKLYTDNELLIQRFPPPVYFVSALNLLTAMCYGERPEQVNAYQTWSMRGWEWGDAGQILRFRSICRDVWRGVIWPEHVIERINGWLEPYLPKPEPNKILQVKDVPIAIRDLAWLVGNVSDLQLRSYGGMFYEDPSDSMGQIKANFRNQIILEIQNPLNSLRFASSVH